MMPCLALANKVLTSAGCVRKSTWNAINMDIVVIYVKRTIRLYSIV